MDGFRVGLEGLGFDWALVSGNGHGRRGLDWFSDWVFGFSNMGIWGLVVGFDWVLGLGKFGEVSGRGLLKIGTGLR